MKITRSTDTSPNTTKKTYIFVFIVFTYRNPSGCIVEDLEKVPNFLHVSGRRIFVPVSTVKGRKSVPGTLYQAIVYEKSNRKIK